MNQQPAHQQPMGRTPIAYALVLRTNLEDLPYLKHVLDAVFALYDIVIVYQRSSTGYLRIVEEPFRPQEQEG